MGDVVRPYNSKKVSGFSPPQTLTGMTGSDCKIIPEFHVEDLTELKDGAILRIYDKEGKVLETYELEEKVWVKQ